MNTGTTKQSGNMYIVAFKRKSETEKETRNGTNNRKDVCKKPSLPPYQIEVLYLQKNTTQKCCTVPW